MLVDLRVALVGPGVLTVTGEDATVDHPRRLAASDALLVEKLQGLDHLGTCQRQPLNKHHIGRARSSLFRCNHRETVIVISAHSRRGHSSFRVARFLTDCLILVLCRIPVYEDNSQAASMCPAVQACHVGTVQ